MKRLNIIISILLFICSTSIVSAEMLDSGKPEERSYNIEQICKYIGQKVLVYFIDNNIKNKIVLYIKSISLSEWNNKIILIGVTEFKNTIVIPIEQIKLMKEIK